MLVVLVATVASLLELGGQGISAAAREHVDRACEHVDAIDTLATSPTPDSDRIRAERDQALEEMRSAVASDPRAAHYARDLDALLDSKALMAHKGFDQVVELEQYCKAARRT